MSGSKSFLSWIRGRSLPLVTRAPDPARAQIHVKSLTFADESKIKLKKNSIIVFTGPNNAGKSTILKEVFSYLQNGSRANIIVSEVETEINGTPQDFQKLLEKAGLKTNKVGDLSIKGYMDYNISNIEKDFGNHFVGKAPMSFFANYLSASERLEITRPAQRVEYREKSPEHPTLWLELDDTPLPKIQAVFQKAFAHTIQMNVLQGASLGFNVVPAKQLAETSEFSGSRDYYKWINSFPPLECQGDGMRSFAGALLSLLVHPRNIVMLDEPEAFLHPPQARRLAETIAQETDENSQLFLATHDTDIVRGLLDAAGDRVIIARINRRENTNKITVMDNDQIRQLWRDPLLRTSSILSSLFNEISIFCEGETDARFYQVLLDATREDTREKDFQFYHVGGKGKIAEVIKALRALGVPSIAVVDIDILNDETTLQRIFENFGGNFDDVKIDAKAITQHMTDRRKVNYGEFATRLEELTKTVMKDRDVSEGTVAKLGNLKRLASVWEQIKQGGRIEFNGEILNAFDRISEKAKGLGLLINPEGELEGFCRVVPRTKKQEWLAKATEMDIGRDNNFSSARSFAKLIRQTMEIKSLEGV